MVNSWQWCGQLSLNIQQLLSVYQYLLVTLQCSLTVVSLAILSVNPSAITQRSCRHALNILGTLCITLIVCLLLHQKVQGFIRCGMAHADLDTNDVVCRCQFGPHKGERSETEWCSLHKSTVLNSFTMLMIVRVDLAESMLLCYAVLIRANSWTDSCLSTACSTMFVKISWISFTSLTNLSDHLSLISLTWITHFNLSPISLTSLTHLLHISHTLFHISHPCPSHLSLISLTSLTHLPHISHPSPSLTHLLADSEL